MYPENLAHNTGTSKSICSSVLRTYVLDVIDLKCKKSWDKTPTYVRGTYDVKSLKLEGFPIL